MTYSPNVFKFKKFMYKQTYFLLYGHLEVRCNLFSLFFLDFISSHKLILSTHNFLSFFETYLSSLRCFISPLYCHGMYCVLRGWCIDRWGIFMILKKYILHHIAHSVLEFYNYHLINCPTNNL